MQTIGTQAHETIVARIMGDMPNKDGYRKGAEE